MLKYKWLVSKEKKNLLVEPIKKWGWLSFFLESSDRQANIEDMSLMQVAKSCQK